MGRLSDQPNRFASSRRPPPYVFVAEAVIATGRRSSRGFGASIPVTGPDGVATSPVNSHTRSSAPRGGLERRRMLSRYAALCLQVPPLLAVLIPEQGCLQSTTDRSAIETPSADVACSSLRLPPVVETSVAAPRVTMTPTDGGTVAVVANQPHPNFELEMPTGQTLVVGLMGEAVWLPGSEGTVGFHMLVQEWREPQPGADPNSPEGQWVTLGNAGATGQRTGPFTAKGRARVPVTFDRVGTHRLRVVVRTTASSASRNAPDLVVTDIVEILVAVHQGTADMCAVEPFQTTSNDSSWLASDPNWPDGPLED